MRDESQPLAEIRFRAAQFEDVPPGSAGCICAKLDTGDWYVLSAPRVTSILSSPHCRATVSGFPCSHFRNGCSHAKRVTRADVIVLAQPLVDGDPGLSDRGEAPPGNGRMAAARASMAISAMNCSKGQSPTASAKRRSSSSNGGNITCKRPQSSLGDRPPAPETIVRMDRRPVTHEQSTWSTRVGLIRKARIRSRAIVHDTGGTPTQKCLLAHERKAA